MTTMCRAGKIGDSISYIVTQNVNKEFDVVLTSGEDEFKTMRTTPKCVDSWITATADAIQEGERRE